MLFTYLGAAILIYLYSSIPFSLLIGFLYGKDIRTLGSGNVGARNLGRNCGTFAFFLGFFLDGSKGVFAFALATILGINPLFLLAFALLGHIFPCFLKFKGGEGISTMIFFFFLYVPILTIVTMVTFVICLKITKYISLSAIIGTFAAFATGVLMFDLKYTIMGFFVFCAALFIYRKSFKKIREGKEEKSGFI